MAEQLLKISALRLALKRGNSRPPIVLGLDLEIRQGETFALLGESGCGKSMTALSLLRLLPPAVFVDAGRIEFNGIDITEQDQASMRRLRGGQMGMIFQEPMSSLNPLMTIGGQIAEAVKLHSEYKGNRVKQRVLELLQAVLIPEPEQYIDRYPHQLSGGMKQRVMIAMALAGNPKLLIADEPTTALDVTMQAQILALLKHLQQERGMSILLITHDLGVVAEMADRVAVMYAGEVVETAPVAAFFQAPKHPYSRMLFASLPEHRQPGERLFVIEGGVPPLGNDFTGCRFQQRCDQPKQICSEVSPDWLSGDDGSGVRCHLFTGNGWTPGVSKAEQVSTHPIADPGNRPLLSVRNLQVHYPIRKGVLQRVVGHLRAVDGVDLDIVKGSVLALVGESGCGKSTVGKGILQLVKTTRGSVTLEDRELTGMTQRELRTIRGDLQLIFQDPMSAMNPRLQVADIIAEGMRAQGLHSRTAIAKGVESLLHQVGLPASAATRYPHQFSGGQRQRICVARALAVKPRVLICDEPTSALDLSVQAQILNLLKGLQGEFQLSYLFISHDISVVSYMADEIAVMYLGRIVEKGRTDEVMQQPLHPYTQALLSAVPVPDPEMDRNVIRLPGEIPSPLSTPSGCHFHPRCPRSVEACVENYPDELRVSETHRVSCWLAQA
ncbi:MAG: ABC transporter ATP-binding protein [Candidatus Thiodiazotropha sp.]